MSHYEVLGVAPDASATEVRTAYRRLARQWHPDAADAPPDASVHMARINEAWSVLSDRDRRDAYDRVLQPPQPARAATAWMPSVDPVPETNLADLADLSDHPPVTAGPASILQAVPVLAIAFGVMVFALGFGAGMPGLLVFGGALLVFGALGAMANVLLALRGDPRARARARARRQQEQAEAATRRRR